MGTLGISDEHTELHRAVRRWAQHRVDPAEAKAMLDADGGIVPLPSWWAELVDAGWLRVHLPVDVGGDGYGLGELAVVLEELGGVCAPGPILPTVTVAAALAAWGGADLVPALAAGEAIGAIGCAPERDGVVRPVLGACHAEVFLLERADGWAVFGADDVTVEPLRGVDGARDLGAVTVTGAGRPLASGAAPDRLLTVLAAAELVGSAQWCVDTAATYACERVQFGRPIGQFQAVKHRCADMLLATEAARAVTWDAVRAPLTDAVGEGELAAAIVGAVVPDAARRVPEDCIQVLGGIGYTWEHDAHLHLRRALATAQLVGGAARWRPEVAQLVGQGVRRSLAVELPSEAGAVRAEVRAFVAETQAQPKETWNAAMAEAGYLVPYWPAPWGRDASPIEQLVIDEEFAAARLRRPHLQVGAWVLPTIIAHGTDEQQQRWLPPTLRGEALWCQLFSEPGAGSDLASLSTRAVRDEAGGGWRITGQKVWTTMAHIAQWGMLVARTDPDAPKHDGITAFVVDMASPGIDIRPLRELTGAALFNEVFFDGVFVPDDCVIGTVGGGWEAARTTLANERVSMGSGSSFGPGLEVVLASPVAAEHPDRIGELVAEAHAVAVLGLRATLRALAGAEPGAESSVRKLLATSHEQHVQEISLLLAGPDGAVDAGEAALWIGGFLGNRALSIAGGTSDIQRNIVAERLLGLPKDP
ncbi:MAG: acyl-CoA dehydrogenase [Acidimicrobiales bacterium]|nr:acyl-CoA dehydrogenase [Acidimicrobiales bacterium]